MKPLKNKYIRYGLLAVPFLLAFIGHTLENRPILDVIYASIGAYGKGSDSTPPNVFLELVRWLGPMATAGCVLTAFTVLRRRIKSFVAYRLGKGTVVCGPAEERSRILEQAGPWGVDGSRDTFLPAREYILADSEEENFAFYRRHRERLTRSTVYLKCTSLRPQAVCDPQLVLYCPEETAARAFWKERCLFDVSAAAGHRLRIVMLGFGKLGEELLLHGLQLNLFDPGQRIEYHIFGDGDAFLGTHLQLASVRDPVIFHREPWHSALPLLEEADMLLVVGQNGQLATLQELLSCTVRPVIDVMAADPDAPILLEGSSRLRIYDMARTATDLDHIRGTLLYDRAKRINHRYAMLYSGAEDTAAAREEAWAKLNTFTRYSNISAADYHEMRLKILRSLGEKPDAAALSPQCMEYLAELEHIRWERYHYLQNWQHGTPADGNKDAARRIHADLVPYSALTDAEKDKDRENIRVLLSVRMPRPARKK